jgi:hypothetical protein
MRMLNNLLSNTTVQSAKIKDVNAVSENNPTHPKVTAAAQGAGAAGAITVVLVWVGSLFNVDVPPEVASAVTTLLATGAAYWAGYAKHEGQV